MSQENLQEEQQVNENLEQESSSDLWSLAGEAEEGQGSPDTAQEAPANNRPEWFLADGVKGSGEKPEWLKEKYKTVAEQAKAYTELEKRMGEFRGSPKDGYKLEDIEGVDKDNPLVKHFAETFKELNLTQEGFSRIVSEFAQVQMNMNQQNVAEEIKKLGSNAKQEITQLNNWITNTFDEGIASTIKNWVMTADDIRALQALKAFQPRSAIPTYSDAKGAAHFESLKEVTNEKAHNFKRYKEDENYRNSLDERFAAAYLRENKGKQ